MAEQFVKELLFSENMKNVKKKPALMLYFTSLAIEVLYPKFHWALLGFQYSHLKLKYLMDRNHILHYVFLHYRACSVFKECPIFHQ